MNIRGILLAGGTGSRFGSQKLAHPLPDGTPLGRQSAINLLAALDDVLVVHRPGDESVMRILFPSALGASGNPFGTGFAVQPNSTGVRLAVELPVTLLASERCLEGMGGSLAAAVDASTDADGWIVALADMPFIQSASIRAVRRALEAGASIAVPVFNGGRGHPVGFSAEWRDGLSGLRGDEGARRILAAHGDVVLSVMVEDAGILRDVDAPADLVSAEAPGSEA